jgi:hypothetical protein
MDDPHVPAPLANLLCSDQRRDFPAQEGDRLDRYASERMWWMKPEAERSYENSEVGTDDGVAPKVFTVDEANRMLPLVSVIVRDIRDTFRSYSDTKKELGRRRQAARDHSENDVEPDVRTTSLERKVDRLSGEVKDLVRELGELGVLIKDPVEGLVDFPFERDGEPAFLCWKHGEERVSSWHGVDEGYSTRRPIDSAPSPA